MQVHHSVVHAAYKLVMLPVPLAPLPVIACCPALWLIRDEVAHKQDTKTKGTRRSPMCRQPVTRDTPG